MVSFLGKIGLSEMLPVVSTLLLEQYMSVSDLSFTAANNFNLSIESVTLIDFALKPNAEKIRVIPSEAAETVASIK